MARNSSNAGKRAELLLDEMQESEDGAVRPNVVAYTLAIRACYNSGDRGRAKRILERMEASDDNAVKPTTRLYNVILDHFAQMGSSLAAQRVEAIVSHMMDMTINGKNQQLKPDVYSYNILLTAWSRSHDDSPINIGNRVWKILQQMKVSGVSPDLVTYNLSIALLAKSQRRRDVYRAETLLQTLVAAASSADSSSQTLQPTIGHYFNVARGWLRLGHLQDAARVMMLQTSSSGSLDFKDSIAPASPSHPRDLFKHSHIYDFDAAVQHWIKAGDLPQATALMEQQLSLFRRERLSTGPSRRTCVMLLAAWDEQENDGSAGRRPAIVGRLQRQMKQWMSESIENGEATNSISSVKEQGTTTT